LINLTDKRDQRVLINKVWRGIKMNLVNEPSFVYYYCANTKILPELGDKILILLLITDKYY